MKWAHAQPQQHGQIGSGVAPKFGESSKERHQDGPPPPPPGTNAEVKITGFGESITSTSAWWRSRRVLWTRCQTAMSFGTGACSCLPSLPDLHDALDNGDNGLVLELTSLLAEGAERMSMRTSARCGPPCSSSWASNPGPPLTEWEDLWIQSKSVLPSRSPRCQARAIRLCRPLHGWT